MEHMELDAAPAPVAAEAAAEAAAVPAGKPRIEVVVRVRPDSSHERSQPKHRNIIETQDGVVYIDPEEKKGRHVTGTRRFKQLEYVFDKVYGPPSTQLEVFEGTVKKLLPGIFAGYNASVFCYGATGAGKTHTMMGDELSMPGIIPMAIAEVFQMAGTEGKAKNLTVSLSYCEIYNETIRDLLVPQPKALSFRVGENGGRVAGLTQATPEDGEEVLRLVSLGNNRRVKAETNANEASSRSHAILQITVTTRPVGAALNSVSQVGKLSLIDLAGSERAAATENRGLRLKEGANINKSLLALGNVINALASKKKRGFVGFRDSKLTRMLQDSLGGNCRTIMLANVSPSFLTYEDTHNTLKYANRAKSIEVDLKKNTTLLAAHHSRYKTIIESLQNQVGQLQDQLRVAKTASLAQVGDGADAEAISAKAKQTEAAITSVAERQLRLNKKITSLESHRNETLLKLRTQHSDVMRWKVTAQDGQEPVRIVTLKADIVMLQAQVASADCELATAKSEFQQTITEMSELTALLPLMSPPEQKYLGRAVKEHQMQMDKVQADSYVQYHKSRETHWEQRFHELEHSWTETYTRMEEAFKLNAGTEELRAIMQIGNKWKSLSDAVDNAGTDSLLHDGVEATCETEMADDPDDLCSIAASLSPPQFKERHSVGVGLNYLERPRRLTTNVRPVIEAPPPGRRMPQRGNAAAGGGNRARAASGASAGGGGGNVPSYMKQTKSSSRVTRLRDARERAARGRGGGGDEPEEGSKRMKTSQPEIRSLASSPSFLKPTLSAVARKKKSDARSNSPQADQAGSERTNLLEERRRLRKMQRGGGGGGGGGGGSGAHADDAEHARGGGPSCTTEAAKPCATMPMASSQLKTPVGFAHQGCTRTSSHSLPKKRGHTTSIGHDNDEPDFKRGRLSEEYSL